MDYGNFPAHACESGMSVELEVFFDSNGLAQLRLRADKLAQIISALKTALEFFDAIEEKTLRENQ